MPDSPGLTPASGSTAVRTLSLFYEQASRIEIAKYGDRRTRVLVTGSRDYADDGIVTAVLEGFASIHGQLHVTHGAARGLDSIADWLAGRVHFSDWVVHQEPAEWRLYSPGAAGPIRNAKMVAMGHDVCFAFPLDQSRGTWDCARKALAAEIPTFIVTESGIKQYASG